MKDKAYPKNQETQSGPKEWTVSLYHEAQADGVPYDEHLEEFAKARAVSSRQARR